MPVSQKKDDIGTDSSVIKTSYSAFNSGQCGIKEIHILC